MYYVNDFKVLHLAYLDIKRTNAKQRFYKLIDWQLNKWTPVSLSRSYAQTKRECYVKKIPDNFIYTRQLHGFNLFDYIDFNCQEFWFDQFVFEEIYKQGTYKLKKIDLWNKDFIAKYKIKDPRNIIDKLIHCYLRKTQYFSRILIIRFIDKILKMLY